MSAEQHRPDASDLAHGLAGRIEVLARELLPAGKRKGGYWAVGSVDNEPGGSLAIHITGVKAGRWQDHATGEFGDALDLVAAVMFRGDKSRAYWWAHAWLGFGGDIPVAQNNRPPPRARDQGPDPDEERRRRAAKALYVDAKKFIAGTPVAAYLANRGIDLARLGRQPLALRFHPSVWHSPTGNRYPAMIAAISDMSGDHIATHRTWLQQDERGAWIKARIPDPKMTLGNFTGGSIRLWRGASGKSLKEAPDGETVVIGEGIETCLSIALACPEYRVLAAVSLGAMASVALPPQVRSIILAADNDLKPKTQIAFQRVVERHLDAGRDVRIARSAVGKDFNDALTAWKGPGHG